MWTRRLTLVFLALAIAGPAAATSEKERALSRGRAIAEARCSRCHAIGPEGASPNPQSPPFRTLHETLPVADVIGAFSEGATPTHPAMPRFKLGLWDRDALIAYVQSIQR